MKKALLALGLIWATAAPAHAGMPFLTLTDVAGARVEALGFFAGLFLVVAVGVRGAWALARRDLPRLPAPSWRLSFGVVVVIALLLQVVLAMISGARELMTPGAWEKRGATYQLAGAPTGLDAVPRARVDAVEDLRDALVAWATAHDGRFPPNALVPDIDEALWRLPASEVRYLYLPGATLDLRGDAAAPRRPILIEPPVVGTRRIVLWSDRTITVEKARDVDIALRAWRSSR